MPPHEISLADEVVERRPHRQPRDAEVGAQLTLGRNRIADRQLLDEVEHEISRLRLLRHAGHRSLLPIVVNTMATTLIWATVTIEDSLGAESLPSSDAPDPGSKKWKRPGSTAKRSGPPTRAEVRGSTRAFKSAPRSVTRSAALSASLSADVGRDTRRVDSEEHVRVRAEVFLHDDVDVDRRQLEGSERRILERLGSDAEHHATCRARPSRRIECNAELSEGDLVGLDRRVHEVHRRRSDEAGDEEILRLLVERLRRVDLQDSTVPHDCNALAQRHRLDLVVRHVDGRHAELLM